MDGQQKPSEEGLGSFALPAAQEVGSCVKSSITARQPALEKLNTIALIDISRDNSTHVFKLLKHSFKERLCQKNPTETSIQIFFRLPALFPVVTEKNARISLPEIDYIKICSQEFTGEKNLPANQGQLKLPFFLH